MRSKTLQYCRVSILLFLFLFLSVSYYVDLHDELIKLQGKGDEIIMPRKLDVVVRRKIINSTTILENYNKSEEMARFENRNNDVLMVRSGETSSFERFHPTQNSTSTALTMTSPSLLYHTSKNASNSSVYTNIVNIEDNESFLWRGAQSRLCTHIKKEKKRKMIASNKSVVKEIQLVLVIPCRKYHERHQHGNFMLGFYAMKLAAVAYQVDFVFRCDEEEEEGKQYLLWWLQSKEVGEERISSFSSPLSTLYTTGTNMTNIENYDYSVNHNLYNPPQPTTDVACRGMGHVALHYTSEYAVKDLRRMAMELLPSMHNKGMIIDEVAIHLRCGDILNPKSISPNDKNYGLIQFQAYRKRIPSTVTSIGIVTAPFEDENRRKQDHGSGLLCQTLVQQLVDYLHTHFPNTTINVRNDPSESIPEVVSRLILAKHNFCVRSTFCLFPSIASYGTSHVQSGGTAYFFDEISKVYNNINLMDEPFLVTHDIKDRGFNSTLQWLTESNIA
jgi:hypothetical protein